MKDPKDRQLAATKPAVALIPQQEPEQQNRVEKELETYSVDLPSPLDELMLQVREILEQGSVAPLRRFVETMIVEADPKEAIKLRDQMLLLRGIGEALYQSAQEAYAAR